DNARKAVRLLREDAANAVGGQVIKNWFALRPDQRPQLPPDVQRDFAKAVMLVVGDWDRGMDLLERLPEGDIEPLWRAAIKQDKYNPTSTGMQVACGDTWWAVADDEQRAGWRDVMLRRHACRWYKRALPFIKADSVRAQVQQRIDACP